MVAAAVLLARRASRQARALRARPSAIQLARATGAEEAATAAARTAETSQAPLLKDGVEPGDEQPHDAEMAATGAAAALALALVAAAAAADPAMAADVASSAAGAATAAAAEAGKVAEAAAGAAGAATAAAPEAAKVVEAAASAAGAATAAAPEAANVVASGAATEAAQVVEAASDAADAAGGGDFFDPWVNFNAGIIAGIDEVIENKLMLPNTFGFAIIIYTFAIKLLTYPLNATSLRSNAMMQLLQPKVKQIQAKYKNDQETMNRMMLRLFDDCGVNPLGGCIPSIVQFPIFIGLYRAINRLAEKNPHFKEPFLWIPSLSGPVEIGKPNLDWLIKSQYEDHFEPLIGYVDAGRYLILPILLVGSQFYTQKISAPQQTQADGPLGAVTGLFPLIIGYTSMVSPAGLGVYWLMNNLFTQAQTQLIRKGLTDEFPEYQRIMDGTAAKEAAAGKEAEEEEEQSYQRGFAAAPPVRESEVIETEAAEEAAEAPAKKKSPPIAVPAYDPEKAAERRLKRRRSQSKRRRR